MTLMDNSGRQVAAAAAVGLFRKELSNCNLIPCLISIDFATDGLLGLETQDDRINGILSMHSGQCFLIQMRTSADFWAFKPKF